MNFEDWYTKYEDELASEYQMLVDAGIREPSEEDWEEWVEEQWRSWKHSLFE